MLRTVDQAVIKVLQEAYNKVWDYTGITKGMVNMFIMSLFLLFTILYGSFGLFYVIILAMGLRSIYNNLLVHEDQAKGRFAKINKHAEEEQSEILWICLRLPVGLSMFILVASTAPELNWYKLCIFSVFIIGMLFYFYMLCLYVRDREPPGKYNHAFGSL